MGEYDWQAMGTGALTALGFTLACLWLGVKADA